MTTDFDAVLAHVAPPGHDPVIGVGHTGKDIGLLDLPANRRCNGIGEWSWQRAEVTTGLREQVEEAQFGEHVVVPVGRRSNEAGEATDAVGEAAGLRVDQPSGEVVPGCVTGERRVGQAGADPVVEPAIEFCQPACIRSTRSLRAVLRSGWGTGGVGSLSPIASPASTVSDAAGSDARRF